MSCSGQARELVTRIQEKSIRFGVRRYLGLVNLTTSRLIADKLLLKGIGMSVKVRFCPDQMSNVKRCQYVSQNDLFDSQTLESWSNDVKLCFQRVHKPQGTSYILSSLLQPSSVSVTNWLSPWRKFQLSLLRNWSICEAGYCTEISTGWL